MSLRPKLKNIDRSTAQQLAITVGNVTVIITDFKEKTRSSSTSSSTITSSAGSEQQHQSSGSESMDKGSSRASTPKGDLSVGHDESFWGPFTCPDPAPLPLFPSSLDTMDPTRGEISPFPLLPCPPSFHDHPWMLRGAGSEEQRSSLSWNGRPARGTSRTVQAMKAGLKEITPVLPFLPTVASRHLYVLFSICTWMWGQVNFFFFLFL